MKIAFSGSRRVEPTPEQIDISISSVTRTVENQFRVPIYLLGDCPTGADKALREFFPKDPVYKADWEKYGKSAGPIRNQAMIDDADALVAFPCPQSKGTWDAIRKAVKKGIPVVIIPLGAN